MTQQAPTAPLPAPALQVQTKPEDPADALDALTEEEADGLDRLLRRIAIRMASGVHDPADILAEEGLDPEDFQHIQSFPIYHQYFAEAHEHWNKRYPLEKRLKMRAQANLTSVIDSMTRLATNPAGLPTARVQAANFLADLAGVSARAQATQAQGSGVAISVNIDLTAGGKEGHTSKMLLEATPLAGQSDDMDEWSAGNNGTARDPSESIEQSFSEATEVINRQPGQGG